jgi:uncharacterized membrane protein YfcA
METLSPGQLIVALAVVGIAYVVRGIAGFGSGLIATPLLLLMLPLTIVVPLVVILDYAASAVQGIRDRRAIAWGEIVCVLPTAIMGVATAFWMFKVMHTDGLVKVLAVFLIGLAIYQLRADGKGERIAGFWAYPAGAFGGLVGTLFGTGGPFYVAYLHGRQLDKVAFRATFSTIFLLDGVNRIVSYALSGFLDARFFGILVWLAPVMALGIFVGRRMHADISPVAFRRGISVLLILSGTILLFK